MHEIVFSYNPYQEGLTTADAKGLMVVLKGVSFGTVLFLLCALRSLLFKAFCSEKHQFLISANHFWQGLEARVGIERHWWRMTLILCLFLQVIQADCVTIEVPGFHLVY